MKQLGQVEVLPPAQPWTMAGAFWTGVASSLIATAVFWYWIHDVWPVVTMKQHTDEGDNVDVE